MQALLNDFDIAFANIHQQYFYSHYPNPIIKTIKLGQFIFTFYFSTKCLFQKFFISIEKLEIFLKHTETNLNIFIYDLNEIASELSIYDYVKGLFNGVLGARAFTQAVGEQFYQCFDEFAYYYGIRSQHAFWIVKDGPKLSNWHCANPFRPLFYDFMLRHGHAIAHSAAVATDKGGALLIGQSGSGKSTTMMACLQHGMKILGDDHCLLSANTKECFALYNCIKLINEKMVEFKLNADKVHANIASEKINKAIINIANYYSHQWQLSCVIKKIIKLEIHANNEPAFQPITSKEALTYLALSTIAECRFISPKIVLENMANIIKGIPTYLLKLSPNFGKNAQIIEDLINEN